jgi:basic membrane protein A
VPAVVRFGHGFVEGAEYAAAQLGLSAGAVTVRFTYLGSFAPSPEAQSMAAAWFADGVEVIFAAAGGAGSSVFAAAEAAGGLSIGVDVDQGHHSETIITSAMKDLRSSVRQMLEAAFGGTFAGGRIHMFDASNQGVGLPANFNRFNQFTQAQYSAIFARLAANEIPISTDVSDPNPLNILTLGLVNVTWIA